MVALTKNAVTVGEGFLRHVNPRRLKFTKLLGTAAAILLALGSKDWLEGLVRHGKSNTPFANVYQGPGSFSRGVDLALGDVSGSGLRSPMGGKAAARPAEKHPKGACRGPVITETDIKSTYICTCCFTRHTLGSTQYPV